MDFGAFCRHDRNNFLCRFPKMKCMCSDDSRYERLDDCMDRDSEYEDGEDKDSYTNEKEEELRFYNEDHRTYQSVVVEKNLCAYELCQLLAVKNRVPKSVHWSLIEFWPDLGIERVLEDHEYVLAVHRDMCSFSKKSSVRFIFRKDYRKYDFFINPLSFFPSDMIDVESEDQLITNPVTFQKFVSQDGICPVVHSNCWVRDYKMAWGRGFLVLIGKNLYFTTELCVVSKIVKASKTAKLKINKQSAGQSGLQLFADLSKYHIYSTLNAKNQFRAPTEWGLCLRPGGIDTTDAPDVEHEPPRPVSPPDTELNCFACDSERIRTCWLTAMRLAKYGKQLRENYRAFKNKQAESINHKEYNSFSVPHESVRSRVAMDFTGPVGRIVEDPQEAKAIAVAEGYSWKKRWRPNVRLQNANKTHALENGIHVLQPWFHSGMSRDQATELVNRHGTDGVFLVRESRSNPGNYVLTYKCSCKIVHLPITPMMDPVREAHVYTLDSGVTKFYDLLQLVEFYQLNAGCLPTRLTQYVVHTSETGTSKLSSA